MLVTSIAMKTCCVANSVIDGAQQPMPPSQDATTMAAAKSGMPPGDFRGWRGRHREQVEAKIVRSRLPRGGRHFPQLVNKAQMVLF